VELFVQDYFNGGEMGEAVTIKVSADETYLPMPIQDALREQAITKETRHEIDQLLQRTLTQGVWVEAAVKLSDKRISIVDTLLNTY
jgi:hypothetical protein